MRELYGKRLEGGITVELRAERAADCEAGCEAAADIPRTDSREGGEA